ncbi:MAG: protein BatD [Proteobacteria bacterium]|nr:protein BatD [Pseudomonadota bacterium]
MNLSPLHCFRRRLLTVAVLCAAGIFSLDAADVSVTAEMSRPEISAGEMAELQIKVTGAQQADVPQQIAVDGLQVRLTGQSTQVQMVNFKVSSSVVYSYIVMPLRTGKFAIPGVTVTADGRQFRTAPLQFSVADTRAAPAPAVQQPAQSAPPPFPGLQPPPRRARPAPQRVDESRLAFGEITCPKKAIFAGEVVPVEIRYYFDANYQVQVRGKVDFGGEGIVAERFPDPKESREERDGTVYNVLTFRTLLSAVKPGTIDVPPAKLDCQVQVPGGSPPGFDDPIFRQLMGGQSPFMQARDLQVKTAPLHLDILPLPKEGRPASFSGAVGQFDIDALVSNPKPAPGDPATLSVKIGGKGNFKGMGAPVLTEDEGWRSYPPTDKFDSSDDLSYSGVKSFDFTLIAQEPKKSSPGAEFSYFDPTTAKYVTLNTKPLPLQASPGSASNPAVPPDASAGSGEKTPSKNSGPDHQEVKQGDPVPGMTLRSWKTPLVRSEFVIATLAMLTAALALLGILWYRHVQAHGGSARAQRRRMIAELLASVRSESLDAAATFEAALGYLELAIPASEERKALIDSLTARRDQLKYGVGGTHPLASTERAEILYALTELTSRS